MESHGHLHLKKQRTLAEEGDESSLAGRSAHWRPNAAGASRVKREGAPASGSHRSWPNRGEGGGHSLEGPNATLEDTCGDV